MSYKTIIIPLILMCGALFGNESFKKKQSPFRDLPVEQVKHTFFYSNKGVVSPMGEALPNFNIGLGFRTQRGKSGLDFNLNYDNLIVLLHSQATAKISYLYYFNPKMDEPQYYFGFGPSAVASVGVLRNKGPQQAFGCNFMLGRETPLNWVERKFFQIGIDVPVVGTHLEKRLPSFQLIFGRSF